MEKFNFKLQKLLDIRKDKEEECKRIFKMAQAEKNITEEKLANLNDNYKSYSEVRSKGTVIEQKITQNYLNVLYTSINETIVVLEQKTANLENKRELLKQTQIERKTVETLREKQELLFIKNINDMEQKNNDEFALYAFIRNVKGGENDE